MKFLRTIGIFLLACSTLCFIIAVERYLATVREAKAIADAIKGFEFESVGVPIETTVCGLIGIVMLVAGVCVLFESFRNSEPSDGLLKSD